MARSPDGDYYDEAQRRGAERKSAVLTEEIVLLSRWMFVHQGYGMRFIALVTGASEGTLNHAVQKHTWLHLGTPDAGWVPDSHWQKRIEDEQTAFGIMSWRPTYRAAHWDWYKRLPAKVATYRPVKTPDEIVVVKCRDAVIGICGREV